MARVVLVAGVLHLLAKGAGDILKLRLTGRARRPGLLVQHDLLVARNLLPPPRDGRLLAQLLRLLEGPKLDLEELTIAREPSAVRLGNGGGVALVRLRLRVPVERLEGSAGSSLHLPLGLHDLLAGLLLDVLPVLHTAAGLMILASGAPDDVHGPDGTRRRGPDVRAPLEAGHEVAERLPGVLVPLLDGGDHLRVDHLLHGRDKVLHAGSHLAGLLVRREVGQGALQDVDAGDLRDVAPRDLKHREQGGRSR
mmetsp:Transcript_27297/g.81314  ORF Transcript_27297/g.81314 Transcript_27297/m.81314 type:complete len:252 (+) Transcript_27297:2293-3048(+)